jgi:histidine kinase/DNA gyrase B/HSP90-like ATPase
MSNTTPLKVRSHIGRDILASAAQFKTEAAVVWEYVVNSLQYVEPGVQPKVQVFVRPKEDLIEIRDNGRGMNESDLRHFFTMHAENIERRAGRPGRGKFGTGKSAAFGIANTLLVDTRRDGLRNVTELRRAAIDSSSGKEVPVDWPIHNQKTDYPTGTTVTIKNIALDRINAASITEYIERHLSAFRYLNPEVAVNDGLCSPKEISVAKTLKFRATSAQAQTLGDIQLIVKIAQAPLPDEDQGIQVTAGPGNLVAKESAGLERKEFGNYLFGEVEVPALETYKTPIQPYDSSRSLQLNPKHPVASLLVSFIGSKLEEVRQGLMRDAKEARKTEQARRLSVEAQRIAEIINRDFEEVRRRLRNIRSASARPGSVEASFGDSLSAGVEPDTWTIGVQEPGTAVRTGKGGKGHGGSGRPAPTITRAAERDETGSESVDPTGGSEGGNKRPRGGFGVEYRRLGKDEGRSKYDTNALAILINLDHPVVLAALGEGNVEDLAFRRLSYEIAFSEYAMALGYEQARQDPNVPADDLLYDLRTTLNRISTAAAALYR